MESSALASTDAMVLAAGLGTRMRPLTDVVPKPLAPIGDKPALGHLIDDLRTAGFGTVTVNAHHLAAQVEAFAKEDGGVRVSHERELLGTAGGLRRARDAGFLRRERVLLVNGDLAARLPLHALAAAPCDGEAVLLAAPVLLGDGNVGTNAAGHVVRMRRETVAPGEVASFAYLGCALLGSALLKALPESGCLVGDVLLPRLRLGARVRVEPFTGPWLDVGSRLAYLQANRDWLAQRGQAAFVHPSAQANHVQLTRSVVGAHAVVAENASLEDCVVWPHARVPEGTHREMIFVPSLAPVFVR
jgi:mannose-1-phosphate guanylyltransferase